VSEQKEEIIRPPQKKRSRRSGPYSKTVRPGHPGSVTNKVWTSGPWRATRSQGDDGACHEKTIDRTAAEVTRISVNLFDLHEWPTPAREPSGAQIRIWRNAGPIGQAGWAARIIETPIHRQWSPPDGLNVLRTSSLTHWPRKGPGRTALKTATRLPDPPAGRRERRTCRDQRYDCGTANGVRDGVALVEGGGIIEALRDRILGAWLRSTISLRTPRIRCSWPVRVWTMMRSTASNSWGSTRSRCDTAVVRHPLRHLAGCYGRDLGRWSLGTSRFGRLDRGPVGSASRHAAHECGTFHIGVRPSRAAGAKRDRARATA